MSFNASGKALVPDKRQAIKPFQLQQNARLCNGLTSQK